MYVHILHAHEFFSDFFKFEKVYQCDQIRLNQVQKFTYYSGHQPFNDIHKHIIVFIVIVAMVINNKMARRCSLGSRAVGFYIDSGEEGLETGYFSVY